MVTAFSRIRIVKIPSIGDMRDVISLQRLILSDDGLGGKVTSYTTVETPYAQIIALSSEEQFLARKVDYRITHIVKLRHSENTRQIKRGDRIIFTDEVGQRFLFIENARDLDNKRRWAYIECSEDEKDRN
jgi:SPP1 family predicted phage head-tail adaptor